MRTVIPLCVAALLLAGCLEAGQTPPAGDTQDPPPITGTGGLNLTLTAEPESILVNGTTTLRAVFRNGGNATVWYDGGGCGPLLIQGNRSPEGAPFQPVEPYACTADFRPMPLHPGAALYRNLTWHARLHDGNTSTQGTSGDYVFAVGIAIWSEDPLPPGAMGDATTYRAQATVHVASGGQYAARITVNPESATVRSGVEREFRITVTNVGAEPLYYEGMSPGCGERSVRIRNATGDVAYAPPTPCPALYKVTLETLAPGETATWLFSWDGQLWDESTNMNYPAPPGKYTLIAWEILHTVGPERDQPGDVRLEESGTAALALTPS